MIRTLIVEDVPLIRAGLRRLLAPHPDVVVVGEAGTLSEGLDRAEALHPDLVFLDVELPDGTGLMLASEFKAPSPAIVFLTAFAEYALPAFGVEALGYLLKPATSVEVARALDRVRRVSGRDALKVGRPQHLEIRDGSRTSFIALDSIDRVDAAGHYLCVHAAGEVHLMRTSIAELSERLGPEFIRVHRSALVRIDRVLAIVDRRNGDGDIHLAGGSTVALSRTYRALLEAELKALGC
ncbi:LytR/AlgR family response regulator transcription factor [Sphingomonas sp. NFX23]|jgi:two-component system LytT family response regulator|uniref:LytR/AlgR family response regulator transcription factor n=1 Tax=Sphingomonas sp. NFX23 TaxID=2819532 RepID=UPI003CEFBA9C